MKLHRHLGPTRLLPLIVVTVASVVAANAQTGCGILQPGQALVPGGQMLFSCNRNFNLNMQSDSNLVLYQGGAPLWSTNTVGRNAANVVMQTDGNLVLYDTTGQLIWASNTPGHLGASLNVQDDGNLVIYDSTGTKALWASNTRARTHIPSGVDYDGNGLADGFVNDHTSFTIIFSMPTGPQISQQVPFPTGYSGFFSGGQDHYNYRDTVSVIVPGSNGCNSVWYWEGDVRAYHIASMCPGAAGPEVGVVHPAHLQNGLAAVCFAYNGDQTTIPIWTCIHDDGTPNGSPYTFRADSGPYINSFTIDRLSSALDQFLVIAQDGEPNGSIFIPGSIATKVSANCPDSGVTKHAYAPPFYTVRSQFDKAGLGYDQEVFSYTSGTTYNGHLIHFLSIDFGNLCGNGVPVIRTYP
jgi:hypothetical protein